MSRSRRHLPISGITTARSEKYDKRIWNRTFRSVSAQAIRMGEEPPHHIRAVTELLSGAKDGKAWHGHAYRDKCGLNWCYIYCWECRAPWEVWRK